MTEDRLQRMEDKIDRMSQAIIAMARLGIVRLNHP